MSGNAEFDFAMAPPGRSVGRGWISRG